jgi:sugar-specific transcriptional regulator TrmB
MMDKDLQKIIESVGFTEKEASVYLALLELSHGTVTQVSKITNLKRPIIYVVLERLIKQGYVTELPNKKINEYQAMDPSIILNQSKLSVKNFADMLPLLQTLHYTGKKKPKINFIETNEGIWKIYTEMNRAKDAFFITSYKRIGEHFPNAVEDWIEDYKKSRATVKGRHLIPNTPEEIEAGKKFKEIDQKVKVFTDVKKLNMDFTIYDNKLAITSLEDEPFLVVIESQALVDSIRPIFEIAWASGKAV